MKKSMALSEGDLMQQECMALYDLTDSMEWHYSFDNKIWFWYN